jgi:hypothetical protein
MLVSLSILLASLGAKNMKFASILAAAAILVGMAVPALAGAPNGVAYPSKNNPQDSKGSMVGVMSSSTEQNGQFIGGSALGGETNYPGQRSGLVQGYLGHNK